MIKFMPVSQKGGTGKTTTSYNFAHHATERKRRSALVDGDEQGNASQAMAPHAITEFNAADLFLDEPLPLPDEFPSLVLIPADRIRLREIEQSDVDDSELVDNLRARLAELAPHFEYMTFDTPGANSRIANAFLVASDFAIIPCKIDPFSVAVSAEVIKRIKFIQQHFNPNLVNFGILANEFDMRQPAQVRDFKELLASHHQYMFPKPILDRQAYREAAGAQVPVWRLRESVAGENHSRIKSAARDAGKEIRAVFDILMERMEGTGVAT